MDSRKLVLKETAIIAAGQVICVAVMLGIFALLDKFDSTVILGGVFGGLIAVLNFFFMAVGAMMAADKAEAQNVKGGKSMIQSSFLLRQVVMFVFMFALVKGGVCDVIALVLPLVFTRPIITISEFFRKPGEPKA